jgi:3',5'-cyclic AMP phosphodiesterase CpdA
VSKQLRIAHLSDLHVIAPRASREPTSLALRTRFVSFGRSLDPEPRLAKLRAALAAAQERGAEHVVFSGDLTELGTEAQFEAFAELLHESGIAPDAITLVPGNHDSYAAPGAWQRALEGPLAAFRRGSADKPGKMVEVGDVILLPLDVACHQPVARAAGELTREAAEALERRLEHCAAVGRRAIVVLHHSPIPHDSRAWQWVDGLRGHERMLDLLTRFEDTYVLHGHFHYEVAKAIGSGPPRVFGTTATVEDEPGMPRVRIYDLEAGFEPASVGAIRVAA